MQLICLLQLLLLALARDSVLFDLNLTKSSAAIWQYYCAKSPDIVQGLHRCQVMAIMVYYKAGLRHQTERKLSLSCPAAAFVRMPMYI